MDKMKKFVDSLNLEELSSREEFVEMLAADNKELDKDQEGLWIVGWNVA